MTKSYIHLIYILNPALMGLYVTHRLYNMKLEVQILSNNDNYLYNKHWRAVKIL